MPGDPLPTIGVTPSDIDLLNAPTDPAQTKTRPGPGGISLTYVDARYVMDMLDKVCGPTNWQDRYDNIGEGKEGVRCGIGILVARDDGSSEWVWKWDVGAETDIEDLKGAHSDALKRAAVKWGIARDLYDEHSPARMASAPRRGTLRTTVGAAPAPMAGAMPAPTVAPSGMPAAYVGVAPWVCPVHGEFKVILGTRWTGKNSKAGRPYGSFVGCTERTCTNNGPKMTDEQVMALQLGMEQGTVTLPGYTTLTHDVDEPDEDAPASLPF